MSERYLNRNDADKIQKYVEKLKDCLKEHNVKWNRSIIKASEKNGVTLRLLGYKGLPKISNVCKQFGITFKKFGDIHSYGNTCNISIYIKNSYV